MTKKLISITLSILLAFSLLVLPVSAEDLFDDAVELALGEKITFDFTYDVFEKYIKFVADKTMTVSVSSETADEKDPYCMVYDADGVDIAYADDSVTGYDFICKFEVTEGETYYILVGLYNFETATTVVSLACGHAYTDGICDYCGNVCDHTELGFLKTCECGYAFEGIDIDSGDTVHISGSNAVVLRFVPEETGAYILRSDAENNDPVCEIFCGTEYIDFADDFGYDLNFVFFAELEAGVSYYYYVHDYSDEDEISFNVTLSKAVHTAEDGAEHPLEYHDYYWGNCQENAYTEGIYCAECSEYIEGHLEDGYGWHQDYDNDEKCDFCGAEMIYEDYPETEINEIVSLFIELIREIISLFEDLINRGFELFVDIIK